MLRRGLRPAHWVQLLLVVFLAMAGVANGADFTDRYEIRMGDLNGDGRNDLYLKYRPRIAMVDLDDLPIPIVHSRRTVGEFMLMQNAAGGFDIQAPSGSNWRSVVSSWAKPALDLFLSDFDFDGNLDILIKNVASVIPNSLDLIVFAPVTQGALPTGTRAMDTKLSHFLRDMAEWAKARDTYFDRAYYDDVEWETVLVPLYYCTDGQFYTESYPLFEDPNIRCELIGMDEQEVSYTVRTFDAVNYSSQAKLVADILTKYADGTTAFSNADAGAVQEAVADVLERPYYPKAVPNTPAWEKFREFLRVLARRAPAAVARAHVIVGGVLYPSDTADDDSLTPEQLEQERQATRAAAIEEASQSEPGWLTFFHATRTDMVPSVRQAIRVIPDPERNFIDDNGFYLASNLSWAVQYGTWRYHTDFQVLRYRMTPAAHQALEAGGAYYRPHPPIYEYMPSTYEFIVPPHLFGLFNGLVASGQILVDLAWL